MLQELAALGNNSRFKDMNLSECVAITDLGLQKFAQQCAEIERLDLSHCQVCRDLFFMLLLDRLYVFSPCFISTYKI